MKLSVIIPAYKFSKYIEQCVLSVLFQNTNFEFEVLVRDDFSNDGSNEILERISIYNPNLKYYVANENWGFHKNIKFLMEESRGEYIAYLDGDDYFTDKDKLQRQIDFLDNNPDYVMHAMGYWRLQNDGTYVPSETFSRYWGSVDTATTEDLMVNNYVGFGRMFRNIPNLVKDYFFDLPFFDYPLNYELSRFGKIKNITHPGGVYREHGSGVLTSHTEEGRAQLHEDVKNYLIQKHKKNTMKTITIIDSYFHNEGVEHKFNEFSKSFRDSENEILLVSNTIANSETIQNADYYLYDKNNILFKHEFDDVLDITLFKYYDNIRINEVISGMQRHGLSVMINLFKSVKLAKSLGFTHFQRVEIDDLHGPNSISHIKSIPNKCLEENKKGFFYFNEHDNYSDISFHYFFCEIDYFLSIVEEINSEKDYIEFIKRNFNNNGFINVEQYIYQNIKNNDDGSLYRSNGIQMSSDFTDTNWNTETSESNISPKYEGCSSRIYKTLRVEDGIESFQNLMCIMTYNYSNQPKTRRIVCRFESGNNYEITHHTPTKKTWNYHIVEGDLIEFDVYDDNRYLYTEKNNDLRSSITFY
jgi:glycosyltransferase involved in cell wall biosynthesis